MQEFRSAWRNERFISASEQYVGKFHFIYVMQISVAFIRSRTHLFPVDFNVVLCQARNTVNTK
jgi:hypothetical protein